MMVVYTSSEEIWCGSVASCLRVTDDSVCLLVVVDEVPSSSCVMSGSRSPGRRQRRDQKHQAHRLCVSAEPIPRRQDHTCVLIRKGGESLPTFNSTNTFQSREGHLRADLLLEQLLERAGIPVPLLHPGATTSPAGGRIGGCCEGHIGRTCSSRCQDMPDMAANCNPWANQIRWDPCLFPR